MYDSKIFVKFIELYKNHHNLIFSTENLVRLKKHKEIEEKIYRSCNDLLIVRIYWVWDFFKNFLNYQCEKSLYLLSIGSIILILKLRDIIIAISGYYQK